MITFSNKELLDEFYTLIKDDYPNLNKKQVKDIIEVPYQILKEYMQYDDFPNIRIQHLGTFTVFGKTEEHLKRKEKYFKEKYEKFNQEYKKNTE